MDQEQKFIMMKQVESYMNKNNQDFLGVKKLQKLKKNKNKKKLTNLKKMLKKEVLNSQRVLILFLMFKIKY